MHSCYFPCPCIYCGRCVPEKALRFLFSGRPCRIIETKCSNPVCISCSSNLFSNNQICHALCWKQPGRSTIHIHYWSPHWPGVNFQTLSERPFRPFPFSTLCCISYQYLISYTFRTTWSPLILLLQLTYPIYLHSKSNLWLLLMYPSIILFHSLPHIPSIPLQLLLILPHSLIFFPLTSGPITCLISSLPTQEWFPCPFPQNHDFQMLTISPFILPPVLPRHLLIPSPPLYYPWVDRSRNYAPLNLLQTYMADTWALSITILPCLLNSVISPYLLLTPNLLPIIIFLLVEWNLQPSHHYINPTWHNQWRYDLHNSGHPRLIYWFCAPVTD